MKRPVLLIDTAAYKPDAELCVNEDEVNQVWRSLQMMDEEELAFAKRVYERSGLGSNNTFLPKSIHPKFCGDKPQTDIPHAMEEAETVLCGAMDLLLAKTGIAPQDIDILVTTCSIFCSTPSLASMIVNRYKLRKDIQSYHLGGMGCSNGVIAVNLVSDLLQAYPHANAVLLTTEVVTPAYYPGKDRARQVTNLLFRMGGCGVLMSNDTHQWAGRAKYQLSFNHRVHVGQKDEAYTAVRYWPDEEGINGIYLGKNVVTEASRALTKAMWAAGPHVLTPRQKLDFVVNRMKRRVMGPDAAPEYTPSFNAGVQHFLLHAGGAKVLDGLGKALQLTERDLEPSRAVLHDYGNVSSSTTWYTMGYIETVRGVKTGDRVMQVGVGSGIKCGVNVWKALRNINDAHDAWEHRLTPAQLAAATARKRRAQPALRATQTTGLYVARVLFWLVILALAWLAYTQYTGRTLKLDLRSVLPGSQNVSIEL